MSTEPTRWVDDPNLDAGLRGDLAQASAADVVGVDYGAGLSQLQTTLAGAEAAAAGTKLGSIAGKAILAALLVAGAVAGVTLAGGERGAPDVATIPEPTGQGRGAPAPAQVVEQPNPPPPAQAERAVDPPPAVAEPESAPEIAQVAEDPDPKVRHRAKVKLSPHEAILKEAKQVARARKQLAGNPKGTIKLVQRTAREFPHGQLVEERRALEIRALAALGRLDAARRKAKSFLAKYAHGPHADAVRRAIADNQ